MNAKIFYFKHLLLFNEFVKRLLKSRGNIVYNKFTYLKLCDTSLPGRLAAHHGFPIQYSGFRVLRRSTPSSPSWH